MIPAHISRLRTFIKYGMPKTYNGSTMMQLDIEWLLNDYRVQTGNVIELQDNVKELVEKLDYATEVIGQRNAELSRGRADFMQALTDPENQPSQWGTVTLSVYQALEVQIREMRMAFKELRRVINGDFYLGSPPKQSLQSQALKIINNALGDGN
jgi:hypothetical protein